MPQTIFVNLPVTDLDASRAFFGKLGYSFNDEYCDDNAICMQISDTIYAMLLRRDFFATFTPHPVADARTVTEALLALSAGSRQAVDDLVATAVAAGGTEVRTMKQTTASGETIMYGRSYADLDGHIWEILWMDPGAA